MKRLIEFSLTQRTLVSLVAILVSGVGWYAFRELPIDAFPDRSLRPSSSSCSAFPARRCCARSQNTH
jgi:Cu/Ag efflux pump CusA